MNKGKQSKKDKKIRKLKQEIKELESLVSGMDARSELRTCDMMDFRSDILLELEMLFEDEKITSAKAKWRLENIKLLLRIYGLAQSWNW